MVFQNKKITTYVASQRILFYSTY